MKYKTHNQKEIDFMGTSLVGVISVSYSRLVELFGDSKQWDEYKTDANWTIEFDDGLVVTIYNYKNGVNYLGKDGLEKEDIIEWNIGCKAKEGLERIILILSGAYNDGRLCNLIENLHSDINDLYIAMDGGKCSDDDIVRSLSGISKYLDEQLDEI